MDESHEVKTRALAAADTISSQLGETSYRTRALIRRIVGVCGVEEALRWLDEARAIEEAGGMLTKDGARRRSFGGVYFRHVRDTLMQARRRDAFYTIFWPKERVEWVSRNLPGQRVPGVTPQALLPLAWEQRAERWAALGDHSGTVTALKLTLVGNPDQITTTSSSVLLTLRHPGALPPFPRSAPLPPQPITTPYVVHMSTKLWNRVADRPAGSLLVCKGPMCYDRARGAVTQFALEAIAIDPDEPLGPNEVRPPALRVTGQAGQAEVRPDLTLVRMSFCGPLPALPKGLVPPDPVSDLAVGLYISTHQWRKVADALAANPDDLLIVKGAPYYDAELDMLAVNVTATTTRAREQAEQQRKAAASQAPAAEPPAEPPAP